MDSRRMPSRPDMLLGNSPLFEYMHPLIPFHALPFSLSLNGKKIPPQAQVHCSLEEWPKHKGDTRKVVNAYGFSLMGSRVVSIGIHKKTISPHPQTCLLGKLTFAYITPLKIINMVLDVCECILVETSYVLGTSHRLPHLILLIMQRSFVFYKRTSRGSELL